MQSIIRHNHSEMNKFSGLLRIIIYSALDTCPSLGTLTINALAAADEVIITVNPQLLAMMGMQDFLRTVMKIRKRINPGLGIAGILMTMC